VCIRVHRWFSFLFLPKFPDCVTSIQKPNVSIMKSITQYFFLVLCLAGFASAEATKGKHLFILSGQSNMSRLKHELSFLPAVEKEFGKDSVVVIRDAQSGTAIGRWYAPPKDPSQKGNGIYYDRLMLKVDEAMKANTFQTISFVWMQGESDSTKNGIGAAYGKSLEGLVAMLKKDLKRDDIYVVIGRLSDHGIKGADKWPKWADVRDAQVKFAESNPKYAWIDTDDLNDPGDGLHYDDKGSIELGNRFAKKAIELIRGKK
jgi:hypothetical protein